jgi:1-acyl-sn-glycerol-3-phosphate acyltransferase/ketopantoate reductase
MAIFKSVLVIGGLGQTGQLFINSLASNPNISSLYVFMRQQPNKYFGGLDKVSIFLNLEEALKNLPEVIILCTPNPTGEILRSIARYVKNSPVIVLPQNGVDVVPTALRVFEKTKIKPKSLIRASLFTTISLGKEGKAEYNHKKLRIALAPFISESNQELEGVDDMFQKSGFKTRLFESYVSMEWTKLITNLLGSTAAITGLSIKGTFQDQELFELETKALRKRLEIMQVANIPFAAIPWQNIALLPKVGLLPSKLLKNFRLPISELIAQGRSNKPPAAARKISEGKPAEVMFYHRPIIELGFRHGLRSPVDEAIFEIISDHEKGLINLANLTNQKRKDLLIEKYKKFFEKPFIQRRPLTTSIVNGMADFFCRRFEVAGIKHFASIREGINKGKSVVLVPNHASHADHPLIVKALRENGFNDLAERLVFVAGMKVRDEMMGRIFHNAYARVLVSTPSSELQSDEEKHKAQSINLKGFLEINRLLNSGCLLVLYAEGTRSRENKLLKAIPSVARYFENPNIEAIYPVAIEGSVSILPVAGRWPRFGKARVTIGEPLQAAELFKKAAEGLHKDMSDKEKQVRNKISEIAIDIIMKKIARLLPKKQRGYYDQ